MLVPVSYRPGYLAKMPSGKCRGAENVEMGGFCSTLMVHDGGEGQQDASIKHLDGQMVQMESAIHVPSHSGPTHLASIDIDESEIRMDRKDQKTLPSNTSSVTIHHFGKTKFVTYQIRGRVDRQDSGETQLQLAILDDP
ncbi:hypothetical protein KCU85_g82, partial [Aureobasidium melanogenum]